MRKINQLIIHCLATRPDWMTHSTVEDKVKEVRRWHTDDRGWTDIGYHYLIDRDGKVAMGRPDNVVGAHVKGHNRHSLGICLVGGRGSEQKDKFLDHYTPQQEQALENIIEQLTAEYGIDVVPDETVIGHYEAKNEHGEYYVKKACPGFSVARWLQNKEDAAAEITPVHVRRSTSLKGNATNIVSGGGLAAVGVFYQDLNDIERYILLGIGGVVLVVGLWLFRKKIKKLLGE